MNTISKIMVVSPISRRKMVTKATRKADPGGPWGVSPDSAGCR